MTRIRVLHREDGAKEASGFDTCTVPVYAEKHGYSTSGL
jgi:hypothetical protein